MAAGGKAVGVTVVVLMLGVLGGTVPTTMPIAIVGVVIFGR